MEVMDDILSGAYSPAYFMGVSHYYHATVDGASGRNRPYYMPSDWYAAIGRKEVIYAAELAIPRARSAWRHTAVV